MVTPIIRVFPRRTSMTPVDDYAFIGDPPLMRPDAEVVHVSVAFTWDKAEGVRLAAAWDQHYRKVRIGGPAMGSPDGPFTPGMYVKEGVTFTTRGCNKRCSWCMVPQTEGRLRLRDFPPGHIIQDNNLLQAPRDHLLRVFAMLNEQPKAAIFAGGLDATLIDDWVAEQLSRLRIREIYMAADTKPALKPLRRAVERLAFLKRKKLRCYVLIGFKGETIPEAEVRLETVWDIGCMPFAQLYQPPDRFIVYSREWKALARKWSRPAAMVASHSSAGHHQRSEHG